MSARTRPAQIQLRDRSREGQPLVTIVTPCFNHGHYVRDGLQTVRAQRYPAIEMLVIDDGSDDEHTLTILDEVARDTDVTVIRHDRNRGLAAALNTGATAARGRYVLSFDSDNRLLPNAVADLVEQLNRAPLDVGFIYPIVQFFGNRHDVFTPPQYNLFTLLQENYCDSCSLIDRDVFDAGARYVGGLFREDWHFCLELAKRGVHGERARTRTFEFRKRGFNRSDLVGHAKAAAGEHDERTRSQHPEFFGSPRRYAAVKADWLPALSVVVLAPVEERGPQEQLWARLESQSCIDAEVLLFADQWRPPENGPHTRVVASASQDSLDSALREALDLTRGRFVVLTAGSGLELFQDRAFLEKVARTFAADAGLQAMAFVDAEEPGFPWKLLPTPGAEAQTPHTVAWSIDRVKDLRQGVHPAPGPLVPGLVEGLSRHAAVQWRALPLSTVVGELHEPITIRFPAGLRGRGADAPHALALAATPLVPTLPEEFHVRPRTEPWRPPQSRPIFRHVDLDSGLRTVNDRQAPPPGCRLERRLGTVRLRHVPGTLRLDVQGGGLDRRIAFHARDELEPAGGARSLGFVEQATLPMLARLVSGVVPETGQRTLAAGTGDPLFSRLGEVRHLGFIEPSPLYPRAVAPAEPSIGASRTDGSAGPERRTVELVRALHPRGRRHCYSIAERVNGTPIGELGGLQVNAEPDTMPVFLSPDGALWTEDYRPGRGRPSPAKALRWMLAPMAWKDVLALTQRFALVLRRAGQGLRYTAVGAGPRVNGRDAGPVGHLHRQPAAGRIPLFAASHGVTRDQLLTPWPEEAHKLGYLEPVLLGYLSERSEGTAGAGAASSTFLSVPLTWAWKLGRPAEAVRGRGSTARPGAVADDESTTRLPILEFERRRSGEYSPNAATGWVSPSLRRGHVHGWARDPGVPEHRCVVELHCDGKKVAERAANAELPCVPSRMPGDRRCGFEFPLPSECFDGREHRLEVKVGGASRALTNKPVVIRPYAEHGRVRGVVQRVDLNLRVEGWAFDREAPMERFTVSVFVDRGFVDEAKAIRPRGDLARAGMSDGQLGYSLDLPGRYFDGREHVVHVLVNERNQFLQNSGSSVTPSDLAQGLVRRMGRGFASVRALAP